MEQVDGSLLLVGDNVVLDIPREPLGPLYGMVSPEAGPDTGVMRTEATMTCSSSSLHPTCHPPISMLSATIPLPKRLLAGGQ